MAVAITQTEYDAAGLRQAAARTKDAHASRRMLALALVLDSRTRTEAAKTCGIVRQALHDWVHRFDDKALPGLFGHWVPGAKPRLSPEQRTELPTIVRADPDLFEPGVAASSGSVWKTLSHRP